MSVRRDGEPFWVEMNLHIPGKGYSLSIHTDHAEMQVYVSEKGRKIQAYEPRSKSTDLEHTTKEGDHA